MSEPTPEAPPARVPVEASGSARWMAPVALVISLLAAAGAGWALSKPAPALPAPGAFAANPVAADPKADACRSVKLVVEGVSLQSQTNLGTDPVALETVAANTRLAMTGGASYLRDTIPSNTPAELAGPITTLANQLQDAAAHYFVGQTSNLPEQADRLKAAADTTAKLAELCK